MIFKNNQISMDTDADHLARAQMMAVGVATYGDELDFTPAQIAEYETYATDIFAALDSQHEESADVDEAYVAVKAKHEETLAKYRACQSVIKGEMEFASDPTREYLDERFDIEDDVPRGRRGFLKMAEFMVSAFDAIAVEHPDVEIPSSRFEELRTLVDELHAAMKAVGKELAEQKEATVSKDVLRKTTGEKLMRKCYHRALAYWGNDDPRMLELGLVPVSSIWTEGDPEPGEPELPVFPNPPVTFKLTLRVDGTIEVVWTGVAGATHMLLEKRKQGEIDWSLVMNGLPADPEEILPYIDPYISPGIWEYRMIPMNGDEHGEEKIAVIEVPEG